MSIEINTSKPNPTELNPIEINPTELCYICQQSDYPTNLVKPCATINCSALAHAECLQSQAVVITDDNMVCGQCRADVIINGVQFDVKNCVKYYGKITYLMVIYTTMPLVLYMLFGFHTMFQNWKESISMPVCIMHIGVFMIISSVIKFYPGVYIYGANYDSDRFNVKKVIVDRIFTKGKMSYRSYLILLILYLFYCLLIICAHVVGYIPYIIQGNKSVWFTDVTASAGFLIFDIFVGIVVFIIVLARFISMAVQYTRDKFSVPVYGIAPNEHTRLV